MQWHLEAAACGAVKLGHGNISDPVYIVVC